MQEGRCEVKRIECGEGRSSVVGVRSNVMGRGGAVWWGGEEQCDGEGRSSVMGRGGAV